MGGNLPLKEGEQSRRRNLEFRQSRAALDAAASWGREVGLARGRNPGSVRSADSGRDDTKKGIHGRDYTKTPAAAMDDHISTGGALADYGEHEEQVFC